MGHCFLFLRPIPWPHSSSDGTVQLRFVHIGFNFSQSLGHGLSSSAFGRWGVQARGRGERTCGILERRLLIPKRAGINVPLLGRKDRQCQPLVVLIGHVSSWTGSLDLPAHVGDEVRALDAAREVGRWLRGG